jgi:hypothetical protein
MVPCSWILPRSKSHAGSGILKSLYFTDGSGSTGSFLPPFPKGFINLIKESLLRLCRPRSGCSPHSLLKCHRKFRPLVPPVVPPVVPPPVVPAVSTWQLASQPSFSAVFPSSQASFVTTSTASVSASPDFVGTDVAHVTRGPFESPLVEGQGIVVFIRAAGGVPAIEGQASLQEVQRERRAAV